MGDLSQEAVALHSCVPPNAHGYQSAKDSLIRHDQLAEVGFKKKFWEIRLESGERTRRCLSRMDSYYKWEEELA